MAAAPKPDATPSIRAAPPSVAQPLHDDAFRLLVESTLDYAIFMLDPEGRIASWNAGAQRTFAAGFDRHLTKPVDDAKLQAVLDELLAGG